MGCGEGPGRVPGGLREEGVVRGGEEEVEGRVTIVDLRRTLVIVIFMRYT